MTVDGACTFAIGDVNFGKVPSFTAVANTNADTDSSSEREILKNI